MKTSELTGAALDWAVAKCEGYEIKSEWLDTIETGYRYSRDWSHGGPIIEREKLILRPEKAKHTWVGEVYWTAYIAFGSPIIASGPTPLIAAMRCFVASKLGDEIELPEGLI